MATGGVLIQLASKGPQDDYISVEPQNTLWRQNYRRVANFATDSIEQVLDGGAGFGRRVACTVKACGDLLTGVVVECVLRRGTGQTAFPAEALLKRVDLYIGETLVERHSASWLRFYNELMCDDGEKQAYYRLVDFADNEPEGTPRTFFCPLRFCFSRDRGMALPLGALAAHPVKLVFEFEDSANLPGVDPTFEPVIRVWGKYAFLDDWERSTLTDSQLSILFEQVQTYEESVTIGPEPVAHTTALPFNHPVKFLAWAFTDGATHARFTGGVPHEPCEAMGPLLDARLSLEGNDRTSYRSGAYFGQLQSYEHFGGTRLPAGMYVYSFAELPRDWRPTGTCNMSRLNSVVLQYRTKGAAAQDLASVQDERYTTASAADLKRLLVFAMNYNVLVIRGGRCVVLFGGA